MLTIVFGVVLFVVVIGEGLGLFSAITSRLPWLLSLAIVVLIGSPVFYKVARAALCHTDVIIRDGAPHVIYPVIPGHEFSGVVEAVGTTVDYIKHGDRVGIHTILAYGRCTACRKGDQMGCENYDELGSKRDGGFAGYCTVPARHLYKLPDHVTLEEAALLECLANAVSAVRQSGLKMGERAVIIGPGPIGLPL